MKKRLMMLQALLLVIFSLVSCFQEPKTTATPIPRAAYQVGDIGPAGGYIIYDCDADNTKDGPGKDRLESSVCGWRYLEAAPSDLRVVDGVPTVDRTVDGYSEANKGYIFGYCRRMEASNEPEALWHPFQTWMTDSGIGDGEYNTAVLCGYMKDEAYVASSGTDKTGLYAAKLCSDLLYNGADDWFLPSSDELKLMYTVLKKEGRGSFDDAWYWSSVEISSGLQPGCHADSRNFKDGKTADFYFPDARGYALHVRPIRAFLSDHIHTFSSEWSADESYHWHQATCEHQSVVSDKAKHSWDEGVIKTELTQTSDEVTTFTCTICGYSEEVITAHPFTDEWTYNETHHWHAATCEHTEEKGSYGAHTLPEHATAVKQKDGSYKFEKRCTECGFAVVSSTANIGDIGPAGGIIFYDKGQFSDGWRYLEAAPADLVVVSGEPTVDRTIPEYAYAPEVYVFGFTATVKTSGYWSHAVLFVNGTLTYNAGNCTGTAIGTGMANTNLLVTAMGNNAYLSWGVDFDDNTTSEYAAKLCTDLEHNGFDDWFLPSKDELDLMCNKSSVIGGFHTYGLSNHEYWSSSEVDNENNAAGAWSQDCRYQGEGAQSNSTRSLKLRIRPIRAF